MPRKCPENANRFAILPPLILLSLVMSLLLGACSAPAISPKASESTSTTLTVAAAASLSEAFTEIATSFQAQLPTFTVHFNFAASGFLQKQIERGAPIDVFASAAARPMDALDRKSVV